MFRYLLRAAAAAAAFVSAQPALAQDACGRTDLQEVADNYLAAQKAGEPLTTKPADFMQYLEQGELASMSSGILSTPLKLLFDRSLLDLKTCATFTEVMGMGPSGAVMVGARLQYAGRYNPIAAERVSEIEIITADPGAPSFDPAAWIDSAKKEQWGAIPVGSRGTREELIKVAESYLNGLSDGQAAVPWAADCVRLEGGRSAGNGPAACGTAQPHAEKTSERHFVVDETIGAVAALFLSGDAKVANVHLLRIDGGKIRYVHTLAACRRDAAACK